MLFGFKKSEKPKVFIFGIKFKEDFSIVMSSYFTRSLLIANCKNDFLSNFSALLHQTKRIKKYCKNISDDVTI
jgi:hypothetical protein